MNSKISCSVYADVQAGLSIDGKQKAYCHSDGTPIDCLMIVFTFNKRIAVLISAICFQVSIESQQVVNSSCANIPVVT